MVRFGLLPLPATSTVRHISSQRWTGTGWRWNQPRRSCHADAGVVARAGVAARAAIRTGAWTAPTSGICPGLLQANVVMLPATIADDFRRFCELNAQPCPLLYVSKPGEFAAPVIANRSDIRADIPAYHVYRDGALDSVVNDITDLWTGDLVTFYLGCSFTFESTMDRAGIPVRNVEQGRNVSMFKSNIRCTPVGPFNTDMVVSMRPIPSALVELAAEVTRPLAPAHGAPVHVGNPKKIGITDVMVTDFGDPVEFEEGDEPCFWACGMTAIAGAISARPSLCITHAPGHMFITDVPEHQLALVEVCPRSELSRVIAGIDAVVQADPGGRGIAAFHGAGDLEAAALAIYRADRVAIATGFPCNPTPPHCETDGPVGAVAIARTLVRLGKEVTFVVDRDSLGVLEAARGCYPETALLPLIEYPMDATEAFGADLAATFDHMIAIERSGRAADGSYYSMGARDLSAHCAPIDDAFDAAAQHGVLTTGIGDGGNELGMGKVATRVAAAITHGELITCRTTTDFTITAGVSNWGGHALCGALAAVHFTAVGDSAGAVACTVPAGFDKAVLTAMDRVGALCGISQQPMVVDGLETAEHTAVSEAIAALVELHTTGA